MNFKQTEDSDALERIAMLEGKANQHNHTIAMLKSEIKGFLQILNVFVAEVSALRSAAVGMRTISDDVSVLKR
jgi:hypothetical protein